MKLLSLLILSVMLASCASHDRGIASEQEADNLQRLERAGDFGPGYRN